MVQNKYSPKVVRLRCSRAEELEQVQCNGAEQVQPESGEVEV